MSHFGFNTQIDMDASINDLPGSKFLELRDKLNTNPQDKDWRALIRCVEEKYRIRPIYIEQWSVNTNGQAAGSLLTELSSQGMKIGELAKYLKKINIDTYSLGLAPYESIDITKQPDGFVEAHEGRSLRISVKAKGNPLPRYQWYFCKNGDDDFCPLEGRIENNLHLDNISMENAGAYACQLHNCHDPKEAKISEHCLVSVTPDPNPQFGGLSPLPKEVVNLVNGLYQPLPTSPLGDLRIDNTDFLMARKVASTCTDTNELITRHPQDVAVGMNNHFCLSVDTQGNPPIRYEWYKGDLPLRQYSPKLEMTIHSREAYGDYYCVVNNGHVTERSKIARVTEKVSFPVSDPEIEMVSQPKSSHVKFGAGAIFSCEARCSEPLKYQWFKNGVPLADKTTSEIKFKNIQDKSVEGSYQCEISIDLPGRDRVRKMTSFARLNVEVPQVTDNVQYNPSDKVALLIGNSDYRSEQNLNCPQYDVADLQELFRKLNFKVVSLLNLTKTEMESAVLEFCKLVDKNVYCVFYFAGHGFEEEGLSYLVPTDAPSGYKCDECVCADAVLDNVQKRHPPLILMVLDICRKRNKVNSPPSSSTSLLLRPSLDRIPEKGNTVFCYATSVGLNAYEPMNNTGQAHVHAKQRCNGLLMQHLKKILTKEIGIDALISELKEEFNSNEKHSKNQIPELRSNLAEPRRSLADKISIQGNTQIIQEITQRWANAHEKPRNQEILFSDVGVLVQLSFQSDFSNILNIFTRVLNKGIADRCEAWTLNPNPSISIDGEKRQFVKIDEPVTTKVTLIDIQKLQNPLMVDVCIDCKIRGQVYKYKTARNLGLPLVSTMALWQPRKNFLPPCREPTEQTEEADSI